LADQPQHEELKPPGDDTDAVYEEINLQDMEFDEIEEVCLSPAGEAKICAYKGQPKQHQLQSARCERDFRFLLHACIRADG